MEKCCKTGKNFIFYRWVSWLLFSLFTCLAVACASPEEVDSQAFSLAQNPCGERLELVNGSCKPRCSGNTERVGTICRPRCGGNTERVGTICRPRCGGNTERVGTICRPRCGGNTERVGTICKPRCGGNTERVGTICRPRCGGNTERVGTICRPRCGGNTERVGTICRPRCGGNTERVGDICLPRCGSNTERVGQKCLPRCRHNTERFGDLCLGSCGSQEVRISSGACVRKCGSNQVRVDGRCVTHEVLGFVADAKLEGSTLKIWGWACDRGVDEPVDVHLYVGAPAGQNGTFLSKTTTDRSAKDRAKIANLCSTKTAHHRYSFALPTSGLFHHKGKEIYVYGISKTGNRNNPAEAVGIRKAVCYSGRSLPR